jgi:hypothetical protein
MRFEDLKYNIVVNGCLISTKVESYWYFTVVNIAIVIVFVLICLKSIACTIATVKIDIKISFKVSRALPKLRKR